jgi:hypothetical protein
VKQLKISCQSGVVLLLITLGGGVIFTHFRHRTDSFRRPEYALQQLEPAELETLTSSSMGGDCKSAYKVARHILYYSPDYEQSIKFLRIAAICPNPDALSHLADLLTDDKTKDREVDALLTSLKKLDPKSAEETSTHIGHKRAARKK